MDSQSNSASAHNASTKTAKSAATNIAENQLICGIIKKMINKVPAAAPHKERQGFGYWCMRNH